MTICKLVDLTATFFSKKVFVGWPENLIIISEIMALAPTQGMSEARKKRSHEGVPAANRHPPVVSATRKSQTTLKIHVRVSSAFTEMPCRSYRVAGSFSKVARGFILSKISVGLGERVVVGGSHRGHRNVVKKGGLSHWKVIQVDGGQMATVFTTKESLVISNF